MGRTPVDDRAPGAKKIPRSMKMDFEGIWRVGLIAAMFPILMNGTISGITGRDVFCELAGTWGSLTAGNAPMNQTC
jgi:hypothetical protein